MLASFEMRINFHSYSQLATAALPVIGNNAHSITQKNGKKKIKMIFRDG
jgi:hypothetical protein